jgi:RNA-directed DNA polymerase
VFKELDSWIRTRIRCAFWQQWKTSRKRYAGLVKRGVNQGTAKNMAGSNQGSWHLSLSKAMSIALPNAALALLGLPSLAVLAKA